MEVRAKAKYLRIAPRKSRIVVDVIRGLDVEVAVSQLKNMNKKAARFVLKLINSAIANAENNFSLQRSNLYIKTITVDDGPTFYRWMPRAFGRATPIRKRTSHIVVVLDEKIPSKTDKLAKVEAKTSAKIENKDVKKDVKPASVNTEESKPADSSEDGTSEKNDVTKKGSHRHGQYIDNKNKKDKGFLKQMFRRKSGQ